MQTHQTPELIRIVLRVGVILRKAVSVFADDAQEAFPVLSHSLVTEDT